MGSTSEAYENGTNVVVYVANEHARLQSAQLQQTPSAQLQPLAQLPAQLQFQPQQPYHRYRGAAQIMANGAAHDGESPAAYKAHAASVNASAPLVVDYEVTGAAKEGAFFAAGHEAAPAAHHLAGCSQAAAPFDGGAGAVASNGFYHAAANGPPAVGAPPYAADDKLAESGAHFVASAPPSGAAPAEAFAPARSESARSVDSTNSVSSTLSASSSNVLTPSPTPAGGVKHLAENFASNTDGAVAAYAAAKQSVAYAAAPTAPYRLVSVPFKEMGANNAAAAAAAATAAAFQKPAVSVPLGWKRIVNNGSVIYISPDSTVLNSLEQVNSYLLTDGNCFCGLDCPLYSHTVFNFDPEVVTSPVPASSGELSKLCNHKRKRNAASGPPTALQNQSYESTTPQTSITSRPLIISNCNPAVVKKYGFDISDRRKKRKLMPGQMYINDDTAVPSTNVMIQNDCDISAKETSTSVINPLTQVENDAYSHQQNGVGISEQSLAAPGVPAVRLKTPAFNQGYPNQPYFNGRPQNEAFGSQDDCYYHPVHEQNNMYVSQEMFHNTQNNGGYVCNPMKTSAGSQQPCGIAPRNQHHRCSIMPQQHRIPCGPENASMPHHHMKAAAQQSHMAVPSQPQHPQQQPQQFVAQTHAANYQQMRVIPNHHGPNTMHSTIPMDGQMNMQVMSDNKFVQQGQSHQVDKNMYHGMAENEHSCTMGMNSYHISKNDTSFCNCYHNDNSGHVHHQPSSCMQDCSNCSSILVQNGSGQLIHHDANVMSSQSPLHHAATGTAHHNIYPNQIQSQQLYPHPLHHHHHHQQPAPEQSQQQQVQSVSQPQQLLVVDPQQQSPSLSSTPHQQQLLSNQVHIMQPSNVEVKSVVASRCSNQSMHPQMGVEIESVNQNLQFIHQNQTSQQRTNWHQKNVSPASTPCQGTPPPIPVPPPPNPYERVPPLHHHIPPVTSWSDEPNRKKIVKGSKSPPNMGGRKLKPAFVNQNHNPLSNTVRGRQDIVTNAPVPSFMDDPSGYLAQQTALLNSTILKQTGENPHSNDHGCFTQASKSGSYISSQNIGRGAIRTSYDESKGSQSEAKTPDSSIQNDAALSSFSTSASRKNSTGGGSSVAYKNQGRLSEENPVTSSTSTDRERNISVSPSGSKSPIQAGTVSTSNQSPLQPGTRSPSVCGTPNTSNDALPQSPVTFSGRTSIDNDCAFVEPMTTSVTSISSIGSNSITSVVTVKSNTTVVSANSGISHSNSGGVNVRSGSSSGSINSDNHNTITINSVADENRVSASSAILTSNPVSQYEPLTKSPLEMVQNVVSSIQIPSQAICNSGSETKPSPMQQSSNLHTSHFLVSNNGQVLMATSGNPQPSHSAAAVVSQHQNHHHLATSSAKINSPLTMINNSSVVTNATGTVTQMIPTVGMPQQMLSQPTVLVNTLPSGQLVFQPSVMALDSAGNAVQIPQLTVATNNMLSSPTLTEANGTTISMAGSGSFSPRGSHQANLLSPESAKRKVNAKKRKLSPQHMLISSPGGQNGTTSVVVQQSQPQQSFAQSTPMLQTLILPNKNSQFGGGQPLIATANVLQPVNLVHNIPTIQQFIVPAGVGGMVMNSDGTATILPETVQLNVLTPVQNTANAMFSHAGGQGILTASPATGMVIRTQPGTSPTAQIRSQAISTPGGTQFIATQSPNQFIVNSSPAFNGQLSPIVANVSPTQQIHAFNTSPTSNLTSRTATPQEYLQCVNAGGVNGQTLMVPCSVAQQSANPQNTTVVQQNTTIVQQQMTMVSNNQQLPDNSMASAQGAANATTSSSINLGQHNIILNDGKQAQNFIITTDKSSSQAQGGFVLSPNKNDKLTGAQTQQHFILNNLNTEKQSQSFIISSPSDKPLCGNFILANTSEKTNARSNLIIASAAGQQTAAVNSQASTSAAMAINAATSSINASRFAKHSVSTQTANAAAAAAAAANAATSAGQQVLQISSTPTLIVATNNTFSQTSSSSYTSSPPDTTTHSPIGNSGQSPDTPSSSIVVGSTDDVAASPTSSTPVGGQPMVHCISSSNVVDWSENTFEDKKLNIIVDHSSSELMAGGIDMFQSIGSVQQHFRRRPSDDSKEGISYIESSTFDESAIRK